MKKTFVRLLLLAVCVAVSTVSVMAYPGNKPTGKTATQTVSVGNYDKLSVSIVDVDVSIGPATGQVSVTAPEYIMQDVIVRTTHAGTLEIKIKNTRSNSTLDGKVKIAITVPYLKEIEASIGAEVKVDAPMTVSGKCSYEASTGALLDVKEISTSGKCDLESSTGAELKVRTIKASELYCEAETGASIRVRTVDVRNLECTAETGASITLDAGIAEKVEFEAETAGVIKASGVKAAIGEAEATLGGDICCKITKATVKASLGGSVKNN